MKQKENFKHPAATRFHCIKCGLCCGDTEERSRHVILLENEVEEIATATSQPISIFATRIDGKYPYAYEMKKTDKTGLCIFLAKNRCTIYSLRPLICRFYPFELRNRGAQEYEFLCTKECPGINKGRVLSEQHFTRLFRLAQARLKQDQRVH
jgi:uncharacterized protein